jgi:type I restriction enzyme, R subunit
MFNEENSVENFVRDILSGELGWEQVHGKQLERNINDVLLPGSVIDALLRLNPDIAANPDNADEVLYKLNAILLSAQNDGLVRANEIFAGWLCGDHTMPFGENNQHVPIYLIDFDDPRNNHYVVSQQVTFKQGRIEKRFDLVLYVNGFPLVIGEAKSATRNATTWFDGAYQVHGDYENNVPMFFVPNVFSFATEGKTYRYGSVRMPLDLWGPWRDEDAAVVSGLHEVETAVRGMLTPEVVLDILQFFTVFATDKKYTRIKIICRYQQYQAANKIVERVYLGRIRKGLIWHFQGSGKSLLMVFAAQKLRLHPALKNPTVIIVVDRVDLDTQITGTFNATDVPNIVAIEHRDELHQMLAQDVRKIIITTIYKFAEADGVLNDRENIIVMVDEAHRTQEGDLGRAMREALPNAFLFGMTGTPINKRDRNTYWAFGAEEDSKGYFSRYSFQESIRDKATLPLHFEARLIELHVDKDAIDEAYANITGHLSEEDQADLAKMAAKMSVLVKSQERVERIVQDIVEHYQRKIEPNGFKAMVVTFDREACVRYKAEMDKLLPPESSAIVMTVNSGEPDWQRFKRSKDEEERLLDDFRDPAHHLQFLIVTSKLLTGFDAPVLQAMYLDKTIKEHNLLQAICRTNRPFPSASDQPSKTHGLIVDYIGVFDDVAKSLNFDEEEIRHVVNNLDNLRDALPGTLRKCLTHFPGVDRMIAGYEGLMAAQDCLPDNDARDKFAGDYSVLNRLWESLSPDRAITPYIDDYRWLSQVYESVKPPSGQGKLIWHVLGAKTLELIHENIHVADVVDDLDTLVMDADFLGELLSHQNPMQAKELEIKLIARLRKHKDNPKFIALGQRLEDLKERHERGLVASIEFLKMLLEIAKDTVRAEREVEPEIPAEEQGMAALTELFFEVRGESTSVMVERVVTEIDSIVRIVRFPGWQTTHGGTREVKQSLRKALSKYQLHRDNDLFEKAYGYIEEYY